MEGDRRRLTVDDVRAQRQTLLAAAGRHGVKRIRILGSVARGQATETSDLDLLVETSPGTGLLALSAFAGEVEDLFQIETQVATLNGLGPRARVEAATEAVDL